MTALEACRKSLRARRVRALEVSNITVLTCRRVMGHDYVTSRGFWNSLKMQAGFRAPSTLPAKALGQNASPENAFSRVETP